MPFSPGSARDVLRTGRKSKDDRMTWCTAVNFYNSVTMLHLLSAPRGKRGWKTFYAILKGLILYLQKVSLPHFNTLYTCRNSSLNLTLTLFYNVFWLCLEILSIYIYSLTGQIMASLWNLVSATGAYFSITSVKRAKVTLKARAARWIVRIIMDAFTPAPSEAEQTHSEGGLCD